MTNKTEKIINGLRTFFVKRYSKDVALDYLKTGKLEITEHGIYFNMPNSSYRFDVNLNFVSKSIY